MVAVMLMSVALVAVLCVVAYKLAVYALPFMLGLTAAQFAYQTGSGVIGAGLVGLDRQRLAAVGLLGRHGCGQTGREGGCQGEGGKSAVHEGTELADHSSGRSCNGRDE